MRQFVLASVVLLGLMGNPVRAGQIIEDREAAQASKEFLSRAKTLLARFANTTGLRDLQSFAEKNALPAALWAKGIQVLVAPGFVLSDRSSPEYFFFTLVKPGSEGQIIAEIFAGKEQISYVHKERVLIWKGFEVSDEWLAVSFTCYVSMTRTAIRLLRENPDQESSEEAHAKVRGDCYDSSFEMLQSVTGGKAGRVMAEQDGERIGSSKFARPNAVQIFSLNSLLPPPRSEPERLNRISMYTFWFNTRKFRSLQERIELYRLLAYGLPR